MTRLFIPTCILIVCTAMASGLTAQTPEPSSKQEVRLTSVAKGTFEVKLAPLGESNHQPGWAPSRMSLDKRFQGDLAATSQGEMMTVMSEVKGSGGYAAFERVQGTLGGRRGTFTLQHHGVMTQGVPGEWIVVVVPDSGTDGLKGLSGRMTIIITGKDHAYAFEYSLPEAP
jgi:hypothetical protein